MYIYIYMYHIIVSLVRRRWSRRRALRGRRLRGPAPPLLHLAAIYYHYD